jgi:hypothetical protein
MGPGTSEAFEWVIRKMVPFAKTASVVGSRGAVAGGALDYAVRQHWMALETSHRSSR